MAYNQFVQPSRSSHLATLHHLRQTISETSTYIKYQHKQTLMDQTRTNQNRTVQSQSKSTHLPNISAYGQTNSGGLSYSQRYEHMTKIANYSEMQEAQIWKEYQKLRICLKELNEEVLHHMEKKAHLNLYTKQAPVTPTVEATLLLLDQERKTNQSRLQIFVTQATALEQRVQHLTNRKQYLEDINNELELSEAKIKEINLENKDLKRKQKLVSKDLLSGPSFLEKLVIEEQALHYAKRKYDKYDQIYKQAIAKTKQFDQKTAEFQAVLENRVSQYKQQEGFIAEQENLEKFQQLQNVKATLSKYETVYKRNYLMKLKELETLVNSIGRHDTVIQETEASIKGVRGEIDQISAMVVMNNNARRRSSMSVMQSQQNMSNPGNKTGRNSVVGESTNTSSPKNKQKVITSANDKNRPQPMKF